MLQIAESQSVLAARQGRFEERLSDVLPQQREHRFGHRVGGKTAVVRSDGQIWYYRGVWPTDSPSRYSNVFGLLDSAAPHYITVEISVPLRGINRRLGGVLAEDPGRPGVVVLHRGSVGGGRPGVYKGACIRWFAAHSRDRLVTFLDGDAGRCTAIRVCGVDDDRFLEQLRAFVRDVDQFKNEATEYRGDPFSGDSPFRKLPRLR